jgi:hypothetical protein
VGEEISLSFTARVKGSGSGVTWGRLGGTVGQIDYLIPAAGTLKTRLKCLLHTVDGAASACYRSCQLCGIQVTSFSEQR